jgi:hypothetical protein
MAKFDSYQNGYASEAENKGSTKGKKLFLLADSLYLRSLLVITAGQTPSLNHDLANQLLLGPRSC